MSDQERWGCGGILYLLVVVGICWFVGFSLLSEWSGGSHAWWHYIVGVPVGVLFFWLISGGGWRWVAGPFVGGVGMAYLLKVDAHAWIIAGGGGYLLVAGILAYVARKKVSRAVAWNSVCIAILGIIVIIVGLIR
jgi:hypothetical protein